MFFWISGMASINLVWFPTLAMPGVSSVVAPMTAISCSSKMTYGLMVLFRGS